MISDEAFEAERTKLIARRDQLRARIDKIEADYRNGLDADSEERAQQLANAEVQEAIARAASEELQRIDQQLQEMG